MKCLSPSLICSFTAATILAVASFTTPVATLADTAAPLQPAAASSTQPEVFTIRYVCFMAQPKTAESLAPDQALAREANLPPVFHELQHGSKHSMGTTPDKFLTDLTAVQPDHNFHLLLCGSALCENGSQEVTIINAGPYASDPLQSNLSDHIIVTRNSPVMVTIHHTGNFSYVDDMGRYTESWADMHTDNIVIGRTYSQGINNKMDGSRLVYTFCVLPGNVDQVASAWSKAVKTIVAQKKIKTAKTAAR